MYYVNTLIEKALEIPELASLAAQAKQDCDHAEEEKQKDSSREYWDTVNFIAEEAFKECKDNESDAYEYIHESVDGSYWIIYYHANYKVMQYTDNDSAYEDYGDLPKDWNTATTFVAFCAMKADVMDKYQGLLDDYEPEPDGEDGDGEDGEDGDE